MPRLLVNGRVSPRTFKGYRRMGGLARELLSGFDRVLAQTGVDREPPFGGGAGAQAGWRWAAT